MTEMLPDFSDQAESAIADKDVAKEDSAKEAANSKNNGSHPSFEPEINGSGNINSAAFLMGLVKWHPAIGSFQFLADCHYPQTMMPSERFSATRDAYKLLFWVCVLIDTVVMLTILVGLGVIAGRIIYMTLFAG